jgi:Flp pilus assembly protein TadG
MAVRSKKGALSSVFLLALIFGLLILGSIAVDFVHGFHVRKQLQVAADSGALAGAYLLTAPTVTQFQQKKAMSWAADMVGRNASDNQPLIADGQNRCR